MLKVLLRSWFFRSLGLHQCQLYFLLVLKLNVYCFLYLVLSLSPSCLLIFSDFGFNLLDSRNGGLRLSCSLHIDVLLNVVLYVFKFLLQLCNLLLKDRNFFLLQVEVFLHPKMNDGEKQKRELIDQVRLKGESFSYTFRMSNQQI